MRDDPEPRYEGRPTFSNYAPAPPAPMVAVGGWCAPIVTSAYDLWSADPWRTRDRPWTAHVDVDRWLFPRTARLAVRVGEYRYRVRASARLARQAFLMLVRPLDHGDPEDDG